MLTVNPSPGTMLLPVVHNDSRDARLITELSVNRMAVLNKAVPRNSMCLYKPGVLPNNDPIVVVVVNSICSHLV